MQLQCAARSTIPAHIYQALHTSGQACVWCAVPQQAAAVSSATPAARTKHKLMHAYRRIVHAHGVLSDNMQLQWAELPQHTPSKARISSRTRIA